MLNFLLGIISGIIISLFMWGWVHRVLRKDEEFVDWHNEEDHR